MITRRRFLGGLAAVPASYPLLTWRWQMEDLRTSINTLLGGDPGDVASGRPLNFRPSGNGDAVGNVSRQLCTFNGPDGDTVQAYLLTPATVTTGTPAILCLHQTHNDTDRGMEEPAGLAGTLPYALELAQRGYVTLAPNYGMYYENLDNGGVLDPFDYGAHGYGFVQSGVTYYNRLLRSLRVTRRSVDVLATLPHAPRSVGVIGHSAGGVAGIFLAAIDPRVACLATSCGTTPWPLYACSHPTHDLTDYRGLLPKLPLAPLSATPVYADILSAIAPRPIFFNAPLGDNISPGDLSQFPDAASCLSNLGIPSSNLVQQSIELARSSYTSVFGAGAKITAIYPPGPHDFPPASRAAAYDFIDHNL